MASVETVAHQESEVELRRGVELAEVRDEEVLGRVVERLAEGDKVNLERNLDLGGDTALRVGPVAARVADPEGVRTQDL